MNPEASGNTVNVPPDNIEGTADLLASARGQRVRLSWPRDGVGTEATGYAVQHAVHRRFASAGFARGGWKIAASTPAQFESLGLTRPGVGAILRTDIHPTGSCLRTEKFVKVGIETEIAFRVGDAAAPATYPLTEHRAASLVAAVMPAFEIIENRYQDLAKMDGATRIADDFLQAACILGAEVAQWQDVDLASVSGSLSWQGEKVSACQADSSFDAMAAFTFVANLLAELGTPLQPGEIVLTGALHKPIFPEQKGLYKASLGSFGCVEFTLS